MKKILVTGLSIYLMGIVQAQRTNWQHLDLEKDGVFGLSTDKAYHELLKNKKGKTIIVAVIDCGIDIKHEDLIPVLWTNPKDGCHGRNYVVQNGKDDITNLASVKKDYYDSLSYEISETNKADYKEHWKIVKEYENDVKQTGLFLNALKENRKIVESIVKKIGKVGPSLNDFEKYKPANDRELYIINIVLRTLPDYSDFTVWKSAMDKLERQAQGELDIGLNKLAAENTADISNTDVSCDPLGPSIMKVDISPLHGTHVAGIVGAVRDNQIGMNGIADHVRIMVLKIYSNGKPFPNDRDLANAIRYAVDNGAKVINMSFGIPWTWDKKSVDEAVKYAASKDVLIVKASGNEGKNLDLVKPSFPTPKYIDGGEAQNWIEVGASGPNNDSTLVASFSNYGKAMVDVFAPGVQIYSTMPGSKYAFENGTSMAAPIVAGLAALLWEYYPKLTALQVKEIILRSVVKPNHTVNVKSGNETKKVLLSELCVSGGVVNAYNAIKLAEQYSIRAEAAAQLNDLNGAIVPTNQCEYFY